ncbi:hypothetical protein CK203_046781 [Vitis vinifera]|uniref:Uncharacterized protein n=1 Tax=Vitis vinifera TaxID=29760 RepID=A0A438H2A9_VITVI|nr:hypothetical protein CK203_046781 [Vitis vinifera]
MGTPLRGLRKPNETMRLIVTAFIGVVVGFFLGVSFPTLSLTKMSLPSSLFPSIDLNYLEDKYSGLSTQALLNVWSSLKRNRGTASHFYKFNETKSQETKFKSHLIHGQSGVGHEEGASAAPPLSGLHVALPLIIWVPTNPRGAERLPPGIIVSESDFYLRRLWGLPSEDQPLIIKFWAWFEILARSLDLVFLLRKAPMHMFAGCQACFGPIETKWAPIAMLTIDLGPAIKLTGILPTFMRSKWPQFKMRRISYPHLRI